MKNTLHLCASKLEAEPRKTGLVATLATLDQAAHKLGINFFVIGATARDLILEHGQGAPNERATYDVDFAIQVANWTQFDSLKTALLAKGFSANGHPPHRLADAHSRIIDIVPFGPIAENEQLVWPPDNDTKMSVAGFDEAFRAAISVQINELETPLVIRVASVAGIALLKIIAWGDRDRALRRKDAQDLAYLCQYYHRIHSISNQLYEQQIMEMFDWQEEIASGYKLGCDAATLSTLATRQTIYSLLNRPFERQGFDRLVAEAIAQNTSNEALTRAILEAFKQGFLVV